MGKHRDKKNKAKGKFHGSSKKHKQICSNSPKAYDRDAAAFIALSQEMKEEGNRLFQERDYEEAMLLYDKAIHLLPRNHSDVSYLRSNMAACYMEFGIGEYPSAIHECNLALEVNPKYTKALLKRARCYEALYRLDLALRDATRVMRMEPNNFMAAEIAERVKETIARNGGATDLPVDLIPVPEYVEPPIASSSLKASKAGKKKGLKIENDEIEGARKRAKVKKKVEDSQSKFGLDNKRAAKKKREKSAKNKNKKNKRISNGVYWEEDIDSIEETSSSDISDEEETVEYNRFEILNDVTLDGKENEGKSKVRRNGIYEEDRKSKVRTDAKKVKDKKGEKKAKSKATETTESSRKAKKKAMEISAEDKLVVEELESRRRVKFIFEDDIRTAQVPVRSTIFKLREIACNHFPSCKAFLIKYKDREGDLVTITSNEEYWWAESSVERSSIRLYIVDVNPDQDPLLEKIKIENEKNELSEEQNKLIEDGSAGRSESSQNRPTCIDNWIIHFAYLFKDYVRFKSDIYLDMHDVGIKLYSEAMEEAVTGEEAQEIFNTAEDKFGEMAALALFNWGNIHMSRARRRVFNEYSVGESEIRDSHSWAQNEYSIAGKRFEEALKIKHDFYEGIIALGQLQFEQAKLSWYHAISTKVDLESWPSSEVIQLYNNAGKNMERGMKMWEEALVQHLIQVANQSETGEILQQMKLGNLFKEISAEETAAQAANIRSQLNLLWGTMLYERSVVEFKLELPTWEDYLEAAADKFERAGASPEDVAVMIKNHCSNSVEVFNVEEAEQAWNEMYEAIRWQMDIPALRLEPLLRQRVSKIHIEPEDHA